MKKRKYQIGGNKKMDNILTPEQFTQAEGLPANQPSNFDSADFQPNYGMKPTFGPKAPESNLIPFSSIQDTGDLTYHPLFQLANILAQGVTGVANKFNDASTDRRNRATNIQSLQDPNYIGAEQDGTDKSPIYAKYGIDIKKANKGKFTAYKKSTGKSTEEALHSKDAHVRQMANFAKNAAKWSKKQAGGNNGLPPNVKLIEVPVNKPNGGVQTFAVDTGSPSQIQSPNGPINTYSAVDPNGNSMTLTQEQLAPYLKGVENNAALITSESGKPNKVDSLYQAPNTELFQPHFMGKKQAGGRLIKDTELAGYQKQGYMPVKGQPNYYSKSTSTAGQLPLAAHTGDTGGGDAYNQKLISLLQQGHSIDDLVKQGYGTAEGMQPFSQYYKPTTDTVYVDPKTAQIPPSRYNMDQRMFDSNTQHAVGDYGWQEQSGDVTNPGTQNGLGAFQPIDSSGKPLNYRYEGIPDNVWRSVSQNNRVDQTKLSALDPYKRMQAGGGDEPDQGQGQQAELEEGENYQTPQGNINKVPEDSGTHEEGGVQVPNVAKVLEDTSDKRKDKASKLLKIQPKMVEKMLGFKPKTALSHSKANEKAVEFYNKKSMAITNQIKKNLDTRNENENDSYALNSMKFNVNTLSQLPSEKSMFNTLFDHQENVKSLFGIEDNGKKGQYGLNAYSGDKSFKGNSSKYSTDQWDAMAKELGFSGSGNKDFQQFLLNQNGDNGSKDLQSSIINLHDKFGNPNTPPAVNTAGNWIDGRLGHRWDAAYEAYQNSKKQTPQSEPNPYSINGDAGDYADNTPAQTATGVTNTTATSSTITGAPVGQDKFNYPLKWYDVAGPLGSLLGDTKAHINYNPAEVKQIRLKGVNPLPTMEQNQSDFNGELTALASTGINGGAQAANITNLAARKYMANNQVLGNAENTNAGIKNQETEYNAGAADKQSQFDQASRADFERRTLGTDEAVRKQKLEDMNSLYTRIAQNKKFNFEGNLLMHLFPNFNATGDYNGVQRNFRAPLNDPAEGAGIPDENRILEQAGIDPMSVPAKDRARYAIQLAKKKFYPAQKR